MKDNEINFIQLNSPDGGFLQSGDWREFQKKVGRKTFNVSSADFWANIIEHKLPVVGKYFYVPRGPVFEISNNKSQTSKAIQELLDLAKSEKIGWIRIDPATGEILKMISAWTLDVPNAFGHRLSMKSIKKAPHDMQPKEIFMIDIDKSEDQLLAEMKSKTRYNIKLAQKKGVEARVVPDDQREKYSSEFIRLTKIMAERQKITPHPKEYYHQMLETIPSDILKLYVAEFEGEVVATNIVAFYGETATYLHGASDDRYKNLMAPYLLQWRQIQDAKKIGCKKYDFGGIKTKKVERGEWNVDSWQGITRFKIGFSPKTVPTKFPGSYDLIINRSKYFLYRSVQKLKRVLKV